MEIFIVFKYNLPVKVPVPAHRLPCSITHLENVPR